MWTWAIAWRPGPVKGLFFYLSLIVDLYSRTIVRWEGHECEAAEDAAEGVRRAVLAERCVDHPRVLHAATGSPMKGETLLETLYRLGIATSYRRPRASHDTPYSEALFRPGKSRPDYPAQGFADLNEARAWMQQLARGYNADHRHRGIRFVTPQQRHSGHDRAILAQRQALYEPARACHPQRWAGAVRNWEPLPEVWLNPTAEVISHPVSEPKRTDAARGRLATFHIKPTATVTRPASDREGGLQGAGGTPAYPPLASATTQSPDPSRDHSPSLQRA